MRILIALVVAVAACGPKNPPGPPAPEARDGGATTETHGDGGTVTVDRPAPLARAECEQMIDHVLELGMAQQRAHKAPEHVPTKEQVAAIRERLVIDQLSACLAWQRAQWNCVMASTTVEALYRCAEGPGDEGVSDGR